MENEKNICKIITSSLRESTYVLKKVRRQLYADIARYQPGLCDDGSVYRIAFSPAPGKTRVKTKTGRFLTKKLHLTDRLTAGNIEYLASIVNLHLFGVQEAKLITGADITEAYRKAIGGSSCMTEHNADKTKLYESNPDKFAMLIMRAGTAEARAIVHTLDNGHKLLDRIYTNNQAMIEQMQGHAKKEGWYYRESAALGYSEVYDANDDCVNGADLVVSDLDYEDGELPYMDTLKNGCFSSGLLVISADPGDFSLEQTTGRIGIICANCGDVADEDHCYYVDDEGDMCESCFNENYFCCPDCEEARSTDGCEQVDGDHYVCEGCCGDYTRCIDCDSLISGPHELASGDDVCSACLENYTSCEDCGELYHNDDVECVGDDCYCENCVEEAKETLEHENA